MEDNSKNQYIVKRDEFQEKKESILKLINENEDTINKKKQENSNLEKTLKDSRPIIEGCDDFMICKNCDIYSMKHEYTIPGQGDRVYVYNCVICGSEGTHT